MSTEHITDAEAFYTYLGHELSNGGSVKSPEELLQQWRACREADEVVAAVEEGFADAQAGRMMPLRELLRQAAGEKDNA